MSVSAIFDPTQWTQVQGFSFRDITYHRAKSHGTVRVAFNRPEVRNAFRPSTVDELYRALDHARQTTDVGCVLLTGNGPSPKMEAGLFAAVAISEFGARMVTNTKTVTAMNTKTAQALVDCTSLRCND